MSHIWKRKSRGLFIGTQVRILANVRLLRATMCRTSICAVGLSEFPDLLFIADVADCDMHKFADLAHQQQSGTSLYLNIQCWKMYQKLGYWSSAWVAWFWRTTNRRAWRLRGVSDAKFHGFTAVDLQVQVVKDTCIKSADASNQENAAHGKRPSKHHLSQEKCVLQSFDAFLNWLKKLCLTP